MCVFFKLFQTICVSNFSGTSASLPVVESVQNIQFNININKMAKTNKNKKSTSVVNGNNSSGTRESSSMKSVDERDGKSIMTACTAEDLVARTTSG